MTFVSSLHMQMWCNLVVQLPWWNSNKQCCCFCPVTRGHEEWLVSFTRILGVNKTKVTYWRWKSSQLPEITALTALQLPHKHVGTKLVFIVKFYLKCVWDSGLKEALKVKSLDSVKVLNFRWWEDKFSSSMWFNFIAMWFVAHTADFHAICHVSEAKDITQNQRETSLHYKLFGKGIVKYNAFKQNFTLFCSTSEPKGVSFTLWIFRWRIFDRHNVLYALGNDKVENDQLPEASNVLYWFEKVPYLLCWKLGRTLLFSTWHQCAHIFSILFTIHFLRC